MESSTTNIGKGKLNNQQLKNIDLIINACASKHQKNEIRLALIDEYLNDEDRFTMSFGDWLSKSKNIDGKKYFAPISFVKNNEMYATHDVENKLIGYADCLKYVKDLGILIPDSSMLAGLDDNEISRVIASIESNQYNKKFGSKSDDSFNEDFFALTTEDVLNFSGKDVDGEFDMEEMKHFILNENEIVNEYRDGVLDIRQEMANADASYSNATGSSSNYNDSNDRSCWIRFPFNEKKRNECQKNKEVRKREEKAEREKQKDVRKQERDEFRADKKTCKDRYKKGEISYSDYRRCVKGERIEKRESIKQNGGGNFLGRAVNTVNRFNPVSAGTRAGSLTLIKQNFLKLATKLVPAITHDKSILIKFKPSAIEKSKKAYSKFLKSWRLMGGSKDALDDAILKGWNKKEEKINVKFSFDGSESEYSNVTGEPVSTGAVITLATGFLSALATLITSITGKQKDMMNPNSGIDVGDEDVNSDVAKNAIDSGETPNVNSNGEFIDPLTGEKIDPKTGNVISDEILGIPKWAFYTGVSVLAVGTIILIVKLAKK